MRKTKVHPVITLGLFLAAFAWAGHAAGAQLEMENWATDFNSFHDYMSRKYAFTQWKGIDWAAKQNETLANVVIAGYANDTQGYYTAIRGYLMDLPDGHVSISPDYTAGTGEYNAAKEMEALLKENRIGSGYGLGITHLDDGRITVYYLTPDGPAEKAGIQTGAEVVLWNGQPIQKAVSNVSLLWNDSNDAIATAEHQNLARERLLTRGPDGNPAYIVFKNPGQTDFQSTLLTAVPDGYDTLNHGNFVASAALSPIIDTAILPQGQGYIRLAYEPEDSGDYTAVQKAFAAAIADFISAGVPGIVVDLRGNLGGHDQLAADLAGHFYTEKTFYETITLHDETSNDFTLFAQLDINPQTPYYGGPVIALVNPATVSSGEGLAMAIQNAANGMVMGFHGTNGSFGMIMEESGSYYPYPVENSAFLIAFPSGRSLDETAEIQLDSQDGTGGITPDIRILRTMDTLVKFAGGEDVELAAATWTAGPQLQAVIEDAVSDDGVPGAVMAVQTTEGAWIGAAGTADLDTGRAMTVNTRIRVAGLTKVFTATLIMKLVEEGVLTLEDTVASWLPGVLPLNGDKITLHMLLNHTSGIPDYGNLPEFRNKLLSDPFAYWTSEDLLGIVGKNQSLFTTPGKTCNYTNTGYYLLGMIAEAATANTVENEINNRLFKPLGMRNTVLSQEGARTGLFSREYAWTGSQLADTSEWNMSWDWTAGSASTTAPDMLRWTHALFNGGAVSRTNLEKMVTPAIPATGYGYGMVVPETLSQYFGEKVVYHSGNNPGVTAYWFYFTESLRTVFLALNRSDVSDPVLADADQTALSILAKAVNIVWQK